MVKALFHNHFLYIHYNEGQALLEIFWKETSSPLQDEEYEFGVSICAVFLQQLQPTKVVSVSGVGEDAIKA
ncbi:hypothetical protein [Eisenibacter elegans]|jgi:hypothetical protein|uniref:hypothetical protein n=1 Tax=Eisenibacter elegans TaxID=997 RepID=UPI0003FD8745|nr:hypothetical protein [Eisenibacter elegans]